MNILIGYNPFKGIPQVVEFQMIFFRAKAKGFEFNNSRTFRDSLKIVLSSEISDFSDSCISIILLVVGIVVCSLKKIILGIYSFIIIKSKKK